MSSLYAVTHITRFGQEIVHCHSFAEVAAYAESLPGAFDVKTLRGPRFETLDVVQVSDEAECGEDFGCLESLSTELACVQTEIRNHFYRDGQDHLFV